MVSVERMTAVLWPLKARLFWTRRMLKMFIGWILVGSILVSMHLHITHKVTVIIRNDTVHNSTTDLNTTVERRLLKSVIRDGLEGYWTISTLLDAFFLVFIPVGIVIAS